MTFDISDTLAPDSDQLDAVDLVGGPRTFTIEKVSRGNGEQPVNVHLLEFDRPWRPGKSMRRVLAGCWSSKADTWVGRRVTLFCDESVRFGGDAVGGTRVSHLSHIDDVRRIPLIISRGRSQMYVVQPLVESDVERVASLRAAWQQADATRRKAIEAEVARLTQSPAQSVPDAETADGDTGGDPAGQEPTQLPMGDDDA